MRILSKIGLSIFVFSMSLLFPHFHLNTTTPYTPLRPNRRLFPRFSVRERFPLNLLKTLSSTTISELTLKKLLLLVIVKFLLGTVDAASHNCTDF